MHFTSFTWLDIWTNILIDYDRNEKDINISKKTMVGFLITQQSNIYIEIDLLLAGFGTCTIWIFPLALRTIFLLKIRREREISESESNNKRTMRGLAGEGTMSWEEKNNN